MIIKEEIAEEEPAYEQHVEKVGFVVLHSL